MVEKRTVQGDDQPVAAHRRRAHRRFVDVFDLPGRGGCWCGPATDVSPCCDGAPGACSKGGGNPGRAPRSGRRSVRRPGHANQRYLVLRACAGYDGLTRRQGAPAKLAPVRPSKPGMFELTKVVNIAQVGQGPGGSVSRRQRRWRCGWRGPLFEHYLRRWNRAVPAALAPACRPQERRCTAVMRWPVRSCRMWRLLVDPRQVGASAGFGRCNYVPGWRSGSGS